MRGLRGSGSSRGSRRRRGYFPRLCFVQGNDYLFIPPLHYYLISAHLLKGKAAQRLTESHWYLLLPPRGCALGRLLVFHVRYLQVVRQQCPVKDELRLRFGRGRVLFFDWYLPFRMENVLFGYQKEVGRRWALAISRLVSLRRRRGGHLFFRSG